ncbi:MAG: hypothetical protein AAGA48_09070 [Myxococcota bacterium]
MNRVHLFGALALGLWGCNAPVETAPADLANDPAAPVVSDPTTPSVSDPTSPNDGPSSQFRALSDEERDALGVALEDLGVMNPMAGTAQDASAEIRTVGPIAFKKPALYDGTGIQYEVTFGKGNDFLHTGVLAWTGLDVKAQTVDEVILILVNGLVDAGTVDVGGFGIDDGIAIIWDQVAQETYIAESGTFEITSIAFATEDDCFDPSHPWGGNLDCTVSEGTLDGELDVTAEDWFGGKPVQRQADFSIPATRVSWSFNPGSGKGGNGKGSSSSACSSSSSDGTRTISMACQDGDCTCTEDGIEVGICADNVCDLTNGCCAAFF